MEQRPGRYKKKTVIAIQMDFWGGSQRGKDYKKIETTIFEESC